jgi:hypothetical protein
MTPQLEAAIAAIKPLSPTERQQLSKILIQSDSTAIVLAIKKISYIPIQQPQQLLVCYLTPSR